ncbi:MAG: MAPEG family protein [Rhizobiaceae bacterium]
MEAYSAGILGLLLISLLPLIHANIVGPFKGKEGLVGGPVADARDENFLFRLDRAHNNTVESILPFVAPAILAIMLGVGPGLLAILIWAFLAIRVAYSVVYLRGGALAKGGSLRTILHVLGSLTTIVLIIIAALAAF